MKTETSIVVAGGPVTVVDRGVVAALLARVGNLSQAEREAFMEDLTERWCVSCGGGLTGDGACPGGCLE